MEENQAHKEIADKVINIIFSALNLKHIQKDQVNLETPLSSGGLELDSVDVLELVVNIERAFSVKLDESEKFTKHFKSIGTIVDFIVGMQSNSAFISPGQ